MRFREINFSLAVAASLAVHALMWPASMRIMVHGYVDAGPASRHSNEVTLRLASDAPDAPPKASVSKPKPPPIDPPDEMGDMRGKGIGAQAAKGEKKLEAPEADQDQAFLSRDPEGQGRVGDKPTLYTGPRGQDGAGGQRGGMPQVAEDVDPTLPTPESLLTDPPMAASPPDAPAPRTADHPPLNEQQPPRQSVVKGPPPSVAPEKPPTDVAPPPSPKAQSGSAKPDITKPPADPVVSSGPLAHASPSETGMLATQTEEGPSVTPKLATGAAPPTPADISQHPAIAMAVPLPLPPAPVSAPPLPEIPADPQLHKADDVKPSPPPRPAAAPSAPQIANTGDARAPGQDRASADPAQESDSESDPFSTKDISAVLHDGKLDVRHGRKVKTTRPHFLPGAMGAFMANPNPTLVLKISIDSTGNVRQADVIESTGSIEIDQPCRVAVYEWWFEPSHNRRGQPIPDVVLFTIHFR